MLRCLRYWKFPIVIIHALLTESLGLEAIAQLMGHATTDKFVFNSSLRQGGLESPWGWNMILHTILDMLACKWIGKGISVAVLGQLPCLCWADNIYFVGNSATEAVELFHGFSDVMNAAFLEALFY